MAIKFVLCRRVDDHSVTAQIAETALPYWRGWEPVPTEDSPQPEQTAPATATAGDALRSEPAAVRKSRTRAATTDAKE